MFWTNQSIQSRIFVKLETLTVSNYPVTDGIISNRLVKSKSNNKMFSYAKSFITGAKLINTQ